MDPVPEFMLPLSCDVKRKRDSKAVMRWPKIALGSKEAGVVPNNGSSASSMTSYPTILQLKQESFSVKDSRIAM